jgi:cell division protein FtsW (lipid II flippase)
VDTWLDPFGHYPNGGGYQLVQSLFGLGTGGLFGAGLGGGRPDQVPVAKSDFIASAVGEELGLFGLVAVIVLYLILVERGLRTSLVVRDAFGKLLAAGLAFAVAWQVFVVLGGVTGLLPLTGLTTPFLAYGGSSLVANFVLVALLVRISDAARRPATPTTAPPPNLGDAPTEVVQQ